MISSEPGVKWIWICLLMIARSFADGALAGELRLLDLLARVVGGERGDEAGVGPVLGLDRAGSPAPSCAR